MIPSDLWNDLCRKAGFDLSNAQHNALWQYLDLLLSANQKMNLTRIVDRDQAAILHVADSLSLLPFVPQSARRLADVGSGGGVPGIPLAIARPDVQVVLIESTRKKAEFLRQTVATLGLANAAIDARRAEQVGLSDQRESFDIAIARALATLDWLAEWCLPLVKVGGSVLAMKGPKVQDEIADARRAIRMLGGGEPVLHPVELPGATGHVIVQVPKISRTDRRYPRDPTVAKRTPLR